MPIKCALFENNITSDPDGHAAMVQISGSADGDDRGQELVDQGSTVNKPDIVAVTAALKLACQRWVEQGSLDELCGVMRPGETVSKLRSTSAPCFAQAPALKQGIDTAPHRDRRSTSLGCGGDFRLMVRRADPTGLAE